MPQYIVWHKKERLLFERKLKHISAQLNSTLCLLGNGDSVVDQTFKQNKCLHIIHEQYLFYIPRTIKWKIEFHWIYWHRVRNSVYRNRPTTIFMSIYALYSVYYENVMSIGQHHPHIVYNFPIDDILLFPLLQFSI